MQDCFTFSNYQRHELVYLRNRDVTLLNCHAGIKIALIFYPDQ